MQDFESLGVGETVEVKRRRFVALALSFAVYLFPLIGPHTILVLGLCHLY